MRRYAFYYRYDTSEEREVLGRLWEQVNVKLNSPSPTRKPIGWDTDKAGRHKRLYDAPRTPLDRLLDTSALTKTQKTDLVSYRNQLNPASITRRIIDLRTSQESLLTTPQPGGHSYMKHRRHLAGTLTRGTPDPFLDHRVATRHPP